MLDLDITTLSAVRGGAACGVTAQAGHLSDANRRRCTQAAGCAGLLLTHKRSMADAAGQQCWAMRALVRLNTSDVRLTIKVYEGGCAGAHDMSAAVPGVFAAFNSRNPKLKSADTCQPGRP